MAWPKKSDNGATDAAFQEVTANPPKVVQSTLQKYGPQRARKQKIAIALSKARKNGAKLPSPKLSNNKAY